MHKIYVVCVLSSLLIHERMWSKCIWNKIAFHFEVTM